MDNAPEARDVHLTVTVDGKTTTLKEGDTIPVYSKVNCEYTYYDRENDAQDSSKQVQYILLVRAQYIRIRIHIHTRVWRVADNVLFFITPPMQIQAAASARPFISNRVHPCLPPLPPHLSIYPTCLVYQPTLDLPPTLSLDK